MATTSWAHGTSGDFNTASNWTNGVPTAGDTALITAPGTYTVTSSHFNAVGILEMAAGATLSIEGSAFRVTAGSGAGAFAGTITVFNSGVDAGVLELGTKGADTAFNNTGTIQLIGVADLIVAGTVTLIGNGSLVLGGAGTIVGTGAFNGTLINGGASGHAISGAGAIGDGALNFANSANGTITAGSASNPSVAQTLDVQTASFTNSGLIQATGAGVLFLKCAIAQTASGQVKTANSGSNIVLDNAVIGNGTVSVAQGSKLSCENGSNLINTAPNPIANAGLIQTVGTNTTFILSSVANSSTGELVAEGGRIEIAGSETGGAAVIAGGAQIFFAGPASANVVFIGNGALFLDDATQFTGSVAGLSGSPGAAIVLTNIPFADGPVVSPLSAGGVLTVTDPVTHVVDTIRIVGGGMFMASEGAGAIAGLTVISG
jgi:hypothetical protein